MAVLGNSGIGVLLILTFVMLWFYDVLFEVFNHGATPGKRALRIRVMNLNGTPVGWSGSLVRNLIRFVDSIPGVFLFGFIAVLLSPRFQRLGDMAANTIVVHAGDAHAKDGETGRQVVPLKAPLSPEEQQAIVSFGERAAHISDERSEELAALLEPVLGDIDATRLRGYANWVAGGNQSS